MPQHVGHGLPHHGGQHGVDRALQRRGGDPGVHLDVGGDEHGLGRRHLGGQRHVAVAAGDRADVREGLPGDLQDGGQLVDRPVRVGVDQPDRHLALERYRGEAVPQQVVQVTGEPQPLPGHREPGQLLSGSVQLADYGGEPAERVDDQAGQRAGDHDVDHVRGAAAVGPLQYRDRDDHGREGGPGPGRGQQQDHGSGQEAARRAPDPAEQDDRQVAQDDLGEQGEHSVPAPQCLHPGLRQRVQQLQQADGHEAGRPQQEELRTGLRHPEVHRHLHGEREEVEAEHHQGEARRGLAPGGERSELPVRSAQGLPQS